ncbi:beta-ketoacyl reductase, partial [Dactylosporangium sp. NPDC051541]|uniref:beta-ketoacyl reductase n=1 Tax=Dactylosporangium sp. NPDC051541 TaxID=3363977 RepID=UPI0037B83A8C
QLLPATTRLVLYSSAAGTLGTPGQGNYAAANTFLDALAHQRPNTTSIAWGLWQATSAITEQLGAADQRRLARNGVRPLDAEHGHRLFDAIVAGGRAHLVAIDLDPRALRTADAGAVPAPLRGLVPVKRQRVESITRRLDGLSEPEQRQVLADLVRGYTATVLGHRDAHTVDPDRPFHELGFDSLTAVELRNRLSTSTGLQLPTTVVFDYPTATALAEHLRQALGSPQNGPAGLSELEQAEAVLRRLIEGDADRSAYAASIGRLRGLLRRVGAEPDGAPDGDDLATATDDELFSALDNELGIS